MRRILFLLFLIALAVAASWVANHAGDFRLNWLGWQIEGSVAFLIICIIIFSALMWLLLHLLNLLLHLPGDISHERQRLMANKGLEQLTHAMIAASENDGGKARKHLEKARQFLPDSPLPRLMQLQLAGRQKDSQLAGQQFVQLQQYDATKPLALRGMAEQARASGKMDDALTHTEALLKVAPHQATTQKLVIDIFSYHRRWQEAIHVLKQAYSQHHVTAEEYRRASATISMQQAVIMLEERNRQGAMEMLRKATSTDPSLQPAAIKYAELLKQTGKSPQAAKLLRRAWKYAPHPELAAAHASLYADLPADKQAKKMQELAKANPKAIESQTLLAEAAMLLEQWDNAKNYLKIALSKQTTVSLCRKMAELYKKGYQDEDEEKRWLEKAVTATPDAHWQCNNCGATPKHWHAHCKECNDFASIYWRPDRYVAA